MKDAAGNEIRVGDWIVYFDPSDPFNLAERVYQVKSIKPDMVEASRHNFKGEVITSHTNFNDSAFPDIYLTVAPANTGYDNNYGDEIFSGMWLKGTHVYFCINKTGDYWKIENGRPFQKGYNACHIDQPRPVNRPDVVTVDHLIAISDEVARERGDKIEKEQVDWYKSWMKKEYVHKGDPVICSGINVKPGDVVQTSGVAGESMWLVYCTCGGSPYIWNPDGNFGAGGKCIEHFPGGWDDSKLSHQQGSSFWYIENHWATTVYGNILERSGSNTQIDRLRNALYGEKEQDHLECPNCAAELSYPQCRDSYRDRGIGKKSGRKLWCCLCGQTDIPYSAALLGGPKEHHSNAKHYNRGKKAYNDKGPVWTLYKFEEEKERVDLLSFFFGKKPEPITVAKFFGWDKE